MIGEIIAIGDELISGKVLNTTSSYIAQKLNDLGFIIRYMTNIGDNYLDIKDALIRAIKRSDFVILTGGLGPTDDDLTTQAISEILDIPLVRNEIIYEKLMQKNIEDNKNPYYRIPSDMIHKLSLLPEGSTPLDKFHRFSGFYFDYQGKRIYCLPGIPSELKLLLDNVIEDLSIYSNRNKNLTKTLKFFGISESELNEYFNNNLKSYQDFVKVGYYPHFPEVRLTITTTQKAEDGNRVIKEIIDKFNEDLGEYLFSTDAQNIEEVVGELLHANGKTLSVAESCTGGLIASMITSVSGASNWFNFGVVTYSNEAKKIILGVKDETLQKYGAVSEETANEMINGLKKIILTDFTIAVTGIAGPSGGTPQKPVGTVYIALASHDDLKVNRFNFSGSRNEIQLITAYTALNWLRRSIIHGKIVHCN